jgi:ubiquinone/menaquinone biosynthesis C-methylase UbiE
MEDNFIEVERNRYDQQVKYLLENKNLLNDDYGLKNIPLVYQDSFLEYYKQLKNIKQTDRVLELGAGTGRHSFNIIESGCEYYGLDVSKNSLQVLKTKFPKTHTVNGRMSNIDFPDKFFDVIVSCASLGYDDSTLVLKEIVRLLKPSGKLIITDSLNNNFLYRLNRYIKSRKGLISKGVLRNLPNYQFLNQLSIVFSEVKINYYGSYLFIFHILSPLIGQKFAIVIMKWFETFFPSKKNAFKFVLTAYK